MNIKIIISLSEGSHRSVMVQIIKISFRVIRLVYRRRLYVYSFRNYQSINLQHNASQYSSETLTSTSLMRFPFSSVPSSFLKASFISLLLANSRTLNKTNQIKNKKVTSWKHTSTVVEENSEDGWCQVCTGRGRGEGGIK